MARQMNTAFPPNSAILWFNTEAQMLEPTPHDIHQTLGSVT